MKKLGRAKVKQTVKTYTMITMAVAVLVVGNYFFKFPNKFTFGGVTGLAIVIQEVTSLSAGTINLIINWALILLGFIFLGKGFGMKTVYATVLISGGISLMEIWFPMAKPLTDQPLLELLFAVFLPAFGSAILFNIGASSGGTDIVAMILRKYTRVELGMALFLSDVLITALAFLVFDTTSALFSVLGLAIKSLAVDIVIENINLHKYFSIICDEPNEICDYITHDLNRSATVIQGEGAFLHKDKFVILTVLSRGQAVQLRGFIREVQPTAFLLITNSSEIIGKGFNSSV